MSTEPRLLNRVLLFLGGLGLLLGGAVALLLSVPERAAAVTEPARRAQAWLADLGARTRWEPLGHSWLWLLALAGCLLLAVLAVAVVLAQRTRPAASLGPARETERSGRAEGGPGLAGAVRITPAVASDSLRRALSDDPDIQSIRVSGPQLRAGAGLVLSITARRGASPARIADVAERALTRWQDLLGAEHPTLIRIGHGSADPRAALDRPGGNDSRPSPSGSAARAPGHTAVSVSPQHTFDHTTRPIT